MNHSPKKTLPLLCGLALAVMLLATSGCGPSETAPEKAAAPSATTAAAAPADLTKPADATKPAEVATDKPSEAAKPADVAPIETPKPAETPAITKPAEVPAVAKPADVTKVDITRPAEPVRQVDYSSLLFVFMLATFIGLGVILRVSRLLHTPLMSLTNAISAIAVVGSIIVVGEEGNPWGIRLIGAIALFASMTNIISGFLITDRMLKMFKSPGAGRQTLMEGLKQICLSGRHRAVHLFAALDERPEDGPQGCLGRLAGHVAGRVGYVVFHGRHDAPLADYFGHWRGRGGGIFRSRGCR